MKKILAVLCILSFASPQLVMAIEFPPYPRLPEHPSTIQSGGNTWYACGGGSSCTQGWSLTAPASPSAGSGATSPDGFGPATTGATLPGTDHTGFADTSALTEAGQTVGCQNNGGFGGSLSNAIGMGLQHAIPGLIRNGLGGFVDELAGQAGPFSGLVRQLGGMGIQWLSGQAQQLAGQLFGGVAQSAAGAIGSAVGSAAAGAAAGTLGSQAGIVANHLGSVTGLASGFLGAGAGASVPVNETGPQLSETTRIRGLSQEINSHTEATQNATEILVYKECIADPLVARTLNHIIANITRENIDWFNTGFEGGPVFIQNLSKFLQEGTRAVTEDFIQNQLSGICTPHRQDFQTILLTQYQYDNNYGARSQCAVSTEQIAAQKNGDFDIEAFWASAMGVPGASATRELLMADDERRTQAANHTFSTVVTSLWSDGFNAGAEMRCEGDGDSRIPVGGYCDGNTGMIVTPGAIIADKANRTFATADEQLIAGDEIGEIIDTLMQQLTRVAFSGIEGLLGLSESRGAGQGSYLDTLVGHTSEGAMGAAQEATGMDINGLIAVEEQYASILGGTIDDLQEIKGKYGETIDCYQPRANTNPAVPPLITHASTTIATILNPQITNFTAQLNDAEDALDRLAILHTQSQSALTAQDVLSVTTQYNALVSSGAVHTATDLTYLENGLDSGGLALQTLYLDAIEKLAACQAL